jgi:hypothetical protein
VPIASIAKPPLSHYFGTAQERHVFVTGYGHLSIAQIRAGVGLLSSILRAAK